MTKRIIFRLIFASLLLPLIPGWCYLYDWNHFFQYLTNWGVVLTLCSLVVTAYMPYSKTYRKKTKLMAWNHALLSLAIVSETIVMVVYWTMLHKTVMKNNSHSKLAVFYQYYAHIVPAIACFYNFMSTDFLFYRGYARFLLLLAIIFFFVNFTQTKLTGNFSYWFLKWQDPYFTALVIGIFCSATLALVYIFAFISEVAKARRLPIFERQGKKLN